MPKIDGKGIDKSGISENTLYRIFGQFYHSKIMVGGTGLEPVTPYM